MDLDTLNAAYASCQRNVPSAPSSWFTRCEDEPFNCFTRVAMDTVVGRRTKTWT